MDKETALDLATEGKGKRHASTKRHMHVPEAAKLARHTLPIMAPRSNSDPLGESSRLYVIDRCSWFQIERVGGTSSSRYSFARQDTARDHVPHDERVSKFDEAILSRVHLMLNYNELGNESTKQVWRPFLRRACTSHEAAVVASKEVECLAKTDFSGRQVGLACITWRNFSH